MNRFLFSLLIGFATSSLFAQPINDTLTDPADSSLMLYGYFTVDILSQPPFNAWYQPGYDDYKPNKRTLKLLKRKLPENLQMFVVMGSWCSDSQREVPRFLKILTLIGYNPANLTLIAVDHQKKTTHINMSHLAIEKVPTFIFYLNNREARIVETPNVSLEKDMLEIVRSLK